PATLAIGHLALFDRRLDAQPQLRFGQSLVDVMVVDGDGDRPITLAQARDAVDGDLAVGPADLLGERFEALPQSRGAAEVTGHVAADPDLDALGRFVLVQRIERGDLVNAMQRNAEALGKGLHFLLGEPAETLLDVM